MERWGILIGMSAFLVLALVIPIVRLYLRTGVFAVVVTRGAAPMQRLVGLGFFLTIFYYALVGVAVGLLGPEAMGVWPRPPAMGVVGWALFCLGLGLMVRAQAQMGASWRIGIDDRPTGLVTRGLYRYVRNPIYSGTLTLLAGLVLIVPSAWTVLPWPMLYLLLRLQTRYEEQHMERLHGEAWRAYAASVGRYVPGVGRLDQRA